MTDDETPQLPEQQALTSLRQSLTPLPMTLDELGAWQARIEASQQRVKQREKEWDALAKEYDPIVNDGPQAGDVKSNTHFRNTHTKIGQLFVRSPKVTLVPKGPATQSSVAMGPDGLPHTYSPADAVATRAAVLNYYLGPEEIDALRLMDECVWDMQSYSGFAAVHVGYRSTIKHVEQPVLQPDPMHMVDPNAPAQPPPMVPVLDPVTQQPQMQTVPVVVHEEWFADKIDAKKVLFDELLKSPRHERKSRWIGHRAQISKTRAKKQFGLSDEECAYGSGPDTDDRAYEYDADRPTSSAPREQLWYTELWYKPIFFVEDGDAHPDQLHHLILFDCVKDRPVVHRPSPDQEFDDRGRLTPNSVRGFPIKVGSLRDAINSPFPKSDAAFTHPLVLQLNTFMRQSLMLRDAAIGKYFYDTEAIDADDLAKMRNSGPGAEIGLKGGALEKGAEKVFATTAQVKSSPDDWRTIAMLKSYMDETLGISATQAGAMTDTVRSATEINAAGSSAQGRQQKEQARVVAFFLSIARAVDQYVFRYATGDRWVSVVGPDGATVLQRWNNTLGSGEYSYDIVPDSQLVLDVARDRQQKVGGYNVLASDPLFRRVEAVRDIARMFGWDPGKVVVDEATAQAQQQLQQAGVPVGQPPPGNGPLNKHQAERSGGTPNGPGSQGADRQERNPPAPGETRRPS